MSCYLSNLTLFVYSIFLKYMIIILKYNNMTTSMNIECLNTMDCNQGAVRAVRFNVNGSYCLTCGSDKKIKLWNPYRNLLLKTYGGHSDEVLDAAGSCDSGNIISCSSDKSVIFWDVSTGQPLRRLRGHAGSVACVAFNEDSTVAVSGSKDNTVCCWDMRSRSSDPIQVLSQARDCVTSIRVISHEISTSSLDSFIRRYDMRNGKLITDFLGEAVTCINYSKDGNCILASCADNTLRLFETISGEMLCEYTGHRTEDVSIESSFNSGDSMVIAGSLTGEIFYWNLVSGEISFKLVHDYGKVVHSLNIHPQRKILLSASLKTVKLWGERIENGTEAEQE